MKPEPTMTVAAESAGVSPAQGGEVSLATSLPAPAGVPPALPAAMVPWFQRPSGPAKSGGPRRLDGSRALYLQCHTRGSDRKSGQGMNLRASLQNAEYAGT